MFSSRNYEQLVGLPPGVAYTGVDQIYVGNSSPNGATNVVNFSVNGAAQVVIRGLWMELTAKTVDRT
jgi:hypothetical protein